MRNFLRFYARVFVLAFKHSYGYSDIIVFVAVVAFGILSRYFPKEIEYVSNLLAWQVPIMALGLVFAVRLLIAPYWVSQERQQLAEHGRSVLNDELTDTVDRLKEATRLLHAKVSKDDLIGVLGAFLSNANVLLDIALSTRVVAIVGPQFEDLHTKVFEYLSDADRRVAMRFFSKPKVVYPGVATNSTRDLVNRIHTDIVCLEEIIRDLSND